MSESIEQIANCADVRALMQARNGRVAVLVVLIGPRLIQLTTYGESSEDKVESHDLKEFIKDAICGGYVPAVETHESFILDAAKVKQERDELLDALKALMPMLESARAAIAKAEGRS